MDLTAQARPGTSSDAEEAVLRSEAAAIVHLAEDGTTIWIFKNEDTGDAPAPVRVNRSSGESSEQTALRVAEHLRGRLLTRRDASENKDEPSSPGVSPTPGLGAKRIFSASTGPALALRSYATPALAWTADSALWLGQIGLEVFFRTTLTRSRWRPKPKDLTVSQDTVFGAGGRVILFHAVENKLEGQALARAGWEMLTLKGAETGPPDERVDIRASFLMSEIGIEVTFAPTRTRWLALGGQALGGIDVPIVWDPRTVENLPAPAPADPPPPKEPSVQAHFTLGAIATVRF